MNQDKSQNQDKNPEFLKLLQTRHQLSEQEYKQILTRYQGLRMKYRESPEAKARITEFTIFQNPESYRRASLPSQYESVRPTYDTQALWALRCPALYTGAFLKWRGVKSSISRVLIVLCGAVVPSVLSYHAIRLSETQKKW